MNYKPDRDLFQTTVGSYLWKMNRPTSDIDYYFGYISDSRSFLLGEKHEGGQPSVDETGDQKKDNCRFEIGVIVHEVMKGNFNHLCGVLSPMTTGDSPELIRLQEILKNNPSKNCYKSILGMAKHNIKDYFDSVTAKHKVQTQMTEDHTYYLKKLNTITRSLEFGTRLFLTGKYSFEPTHYQTRKDIDLVIEQYKEAFQKSTLPAQPDPKPFEDYLLELRMKDLKEYTDFSNTFDSIYKQAGVNSTFNLITSYAWSRQTCVWCKIRPATHECTRGGLSPCCDECCGLPKDLRNNEVEIVDKALKETKKDSK